MFHIGAHMQANYHKFKNLFLRQSYLDSWEDYMRSLQKTSFIKWDYVILTASNEAQAEAFRMQIRQRLERRLLPASTKYVVLPDPDGKRVGSGGATFNVLRYIAEENNCKDIFASKRILVIHSGGDSKRVPQYSAVGKLFSPVPRTLPDGRGSTLFDEFIIGMSGVPSRIREGMLVLSGDVLLLFNPLQIDTQFDGAAAISIKEPVETGRHHGVFLNDGKGHVRNFLHKQSEESLRAIGAVNDHGTVDLDTGAILLNVSLLNALYGLISTDGRPDAEKFDAFVNDQVRISFYGDFLYPLASDSTLEQYYEEKPEGEDSAQLRQCRKLIWEAISGYSMKLLRLSPARFIHFGTTKELCRLVTEEIADYEFLDWRSQVRSTNNTGGSYASYGSYVGRRAQIGKGTYLEQSYVLDASVVGAGSIVSHVKLRNVAVPEATVLHGLALEDGRYVTRIYGVTDNPKESCAEGASFLGTSLPEWMAAYGLKASDLWKDGETQDLWNARLFPVCDSPEESVSWALKVYELACGVQAVAEARRQQESDAPAEVWLADSSATSEEQQLHAGRSCTPAEGQLVGSSCDLAAEWLAQPRTSLCESFNRADMGKLLAWERDLENRILSRIFIDRLNEGVYYKEALQIFGQQGITEEIYHTLMEDASRADFSLKIRIYYAVAQYMKEKALCFVGQDYDYLEGLCFATIREAVSAEAMKQLPDAAAYRIARDSVDVQLPVRVNWGGGWTDTPPYCNENGGIVLNAAISLKGNLPVQISIRRLSEYHVEFESQDVGVRGSAYTVEEIQDCHNPYDSFALHKAALIACGIIPLQHTEESLEDILKRIGGGIYLSTQVVGVPKGSGLGTSSILSGACVKGIFEFLGIEKSHEEIYGIVLCMEQIMSTGGGWQDQVGGLAPGIKLLTTEPGMDQRIHAKQIKVPKAAMEELQERFALIYTGQRRLARNLLREVLGNYIGAKPESIAALQEMKPVAMQMAQALEQGRIDAFAVLLDKHWELSKQLDKGTTNTCIDQIILACEDFIDARFIAGAGGGGFVMVILKKEVTRQQLREHLLEIFQDSGVDVWETGFVME